ncbi:hypothetical protein [Sulfitobacter sp. M368]|jgi:hypothetical protein|uniref:hypothetical protein n=1 Tax=Sulfitobacter sp. M368 TaxID=2867021 RepID=UPI0021A8B4DD|nr:hypothetical protein [Sulfitobacter sp. M368]UWR14194.1 hypothetical protein K3754_12850 [Sulfitobacter sp. M368]
MPVIVRFYIQHTIIGFVASAAFIGALLYFNVANLWHLISTSDIGLLAGFLLWFFNGIVFSGAQTAVAVLLMSESDEDDGPKGGKGIAVPVLAQVRRP